MPNQEKTAAVAEITEALRGSSAALLTDYRGLKVSELTELRRSLGADTTYAVVKNTLTRIALRDGDVSADEIARLEPLLVGPTAIAFVSGDAVEAAKALRDFARTHAALVVKGGLLDSRALDADEIRRLADLESREVLLAKLAGALQGSLSQAVRLFAAPLTQAARVIAALAAKAEQDPAVLAASDAATASGPHAAVDTPADPTAVVTEAVEITAEGVVVEQAPAGDETLPAVTAAGTEAPAGDSGLAPDEPPSEQSPSTDG